MNWKKLFRIVLLLTFLLLVFFWLRSNFWQIKSLDCWFNQLNCSQEVHQKISKFCLGRNLIFLSSKKLTEEITKDLPQVDNIKIKKRIPNRLVLELTSRKPVVALAIELFSERENNAFDKPQFSLSGIFYLMDEKGVVVKKAEEAQNLPLILFKKDPQLENGQKFDQEEVLKTIEIILGMKLRLLEPKISYVESIREIKVWSDEGTLIVFNGQKDIEIQLDSLQFISSRSKIEGKKIKKIDLRFDKPVIVQD